MKKIFALVIVTPILALFAGIGVLAFNIAGVWDERNTDVLISNISLICGLGGLAVAVTLATLIGVVLFARWQRAREMDGVASWRNTPRMLPQPAPYPTHPWLEAPPALPGTPEVKGRLYSTGPSGYEDLDNSLFAGDQPTDADWRETL